MKVSAKPDGWRYPLLALCYGVVSIFAFGFAYSPAQVVAESISVDDALHHLRIAGPREWADFPLEAEAERLELKFRAERNASEATLRLRQQDVKQTWSVLVNGENVGKLVQDENDQTAYFALPPDTMIDGENTIVIEQKTGGKPTTDDIRVGEVAIDSRAVGALLSEATATIQVIDRKTGEPIPARLTIVNSERALQTVGAESGDSLAVRTGVVYTANGKAEFGLPAGSYRVYAGRGFEYSLDSVDFTVTAGDSVEKTLSLVRQVDTHGMVACDTHVHTRTHSGHGDCIVQERMTTLAGEGIELPIATDHNVQIDHRPFAKAAKVECYFTPVVGNEVTTKTGHFNVFPTTAEAPRPDHTLTNWNDLFDSIYSTPGVKIAILNHARDIHTGVRPFGSRLFNEAAGANVEERAMRFNAMEVINSGAVQTDPLELLRDYMALLNRGRLITPVGSSDSHDVSRYIVGQGRTYIYCDDSSPGAIDIEQAVNSFEQGRVAVSYGLLTELRVADKYGPGELCRTAKGETKVEIRVSGPHWVEATKVVLYANGNAVQQWEIAPSERTADSSGLIWKTEWKLPPQKHDVHLVAIATGPGVDGLYWKTARPYQPTSPVWESIVVGASGAIWLDADGDGKRTSARAYAERVFHQSEGDLKRMVELLRDFDSAVATQAAHLIQTSGQSLLAEAATEIIETASPETKAGFQSYIRAWQKTQRARVESQ